MSVARFHEKQEEEGGGGHGKPGLEGRQWGGGG